MDNAYTQVKTHLATHPYQWVVTGAAGFIGSNLVETLLRLNQRVVGLDNFATGFARNLEQVREKVGSEAWRNFTFIEGDICSLEDCRRSVANADFVLHHAALGSVPRSIEEPITANHANITGFVNMLVASRDARVSDSFMRHPARPTVIILVFLRLRT